MPAKWFECPDGGIVEIPECLRQCRMATRCATKAYLSEVAREREWTGTPSVTLLLRGTKESFLRILTDYPLSPDKEAFRVAGTVVHSKLETFSADSICERTFSLANISGTVDLIERETLQDGSVINIMYDNKNSGSYAVAKAMGMRASTEPALDDSGVPIIRGGKVVTRKVFSVDKAASDNYDYEMQTNMYRIMAEKELGIDIHAMFNFFVVRDGGTISARGYGIYNNTALVRIKRLNDNDVLSYFIEKRDALLNAIAKRRVPVECTPRESWGGNKCKRCNVRGMCKNLKGGDII